MKDNAFSKSMVAFVIVPLVAIFLFTLSCGPTQAPAPAATSAPAPAAATAPAPAKPLRIGGSLPLTGAYAETAKWIKEGYEFWRDDINKRGGLLGRPVELIIYDDGSSVEKAVTSYEKAITVDKVDLLLGGYPGTANVAVMPLVEKYRMVYVSMGGHLQAHSQGLKYSFASPALFGEWYGGVLGVVMDMLPADQRPKTLAAMTMNTVIGQAVRTGFTESVPKTGLKVVMDELYALPLADATPPVSKAKDAGGEILFLNGAFDDSVLAMRAAKAMKYNPKLIIQTIGADSPGWVKELGEDGDYVVKGTFWHPALPYPRVKELNEAAKARLNLTEAPLYMGYGYSWMMTLELAVQGAGVLDQDKIRNYLATQKFDLPYGLGIKFDDRGLPPAFIGATQVLKGKVELIYPEKGATGKLAYPRPAMWK